MNSTVEEKEVEKKMEYIPLPKLPPIFYKFHARSLKAKVKKACVKIRK